VKEKMGHVLAAPIEEAEAIVVAATAVQPVVCIELVLMNFPEEGAISFCMSMTEYSSESIMNFTSLPQLNSYLPSRTVKYE